MAEAVTSGPPVDQRVDLIDQIGALWAEQQRIFDERRGQPQRFNHVVLIGVGFHEPQRVIDTEHGDQTGIIGEDCSQAADGEPQFR